MGGLPVAADRLASAFSIHSREHAVIVLSPSGVRSNQEAGLCQFPE